MTDHADPTIRSLQAAVADLQSRVEAIEVQKIPLSKLTPEDVRAIRRRRATGETCLSIQRDYPVSLTTIWRVGARIQWRQILDLPEEEPQP